MRAWWRLCRRPGLSLDSPEMRAEAARARAQLGEAKILRQRIEYHVRENHLAARMKAALEGIPDP